MASKPSGNSCRVSSPWWLHIGHGSPASPQPQAYSPSHGLFGWFSQTHRLLSQRAHHLISEYPSRHSSGISRGARLMRLTKKSRPKAASARSSSVTSLQRQPHFGRRCLVDFERGLPPFFCPAVLWFFLLECWSRLEPSDGAFPGRRPVLSPCPDRSPA
jgi:hypothetical protein